MLTVEKAVLQIMDGTSDLCVISQKEMDLNDPETRGFLEKHMGRILTDPAGRAGDGGEHGVADGDLAVFGGDFYHSGLPFCGNGIITHDNMEYYILLSPGLQ